MTAQAGQIDISEATPADSEAIWRWRNDPLTRAMSKSTEEVPRAAHEKWFAAALADPSRILLVGRIADTGEAIGMCRFDLAEDGASAEASINLAPAARGRGLSGPLLGTAIAWFAGRHPVRLTATIREANMASRRCFQGCGFREAGSRDGLLFYERPAG